MLGVVVANLKKASMLQHERLKLMSTYEGLFLRQLCVSETSLLRM